MQTQTHSIQYMHMLNYIIGYINQSYNTRLVKRKLRLACFTISILEV